MTTRDIDLLDGDFSVNDPYPTYAWMRDHAPGYRDVTNELRGITRNDDIVERITAGTAPEEMPNAFAYGLAAAHLDLEFA